MRNYRKQREEYRKMGKGYYHLVTDGWKDGNIFNNIAQFAYGMILIGLITLKYSIVIYDFILMPNHIHIILSGTGDDAVEAFLYLKRKLNMRLAANHYKPLPEDYGFKLIPVEDKLQMMELIIYLDRNHYEKGFAVPGGYPWGSGYLQYSLFADLLHGKRVSEFGSKELEALTGSRTRLPKHWEIHPVLGLLPKSFVNTKLVKKLFNGPKDYMTRLVKAYESFVSIARKCGEEIEFDSNELKDIISQILLSDFEGRTLYQLDKDELGRLAVKMSKRFDIKAQVIADNLGVSIHLVNQFLRSKDYGRGR
ncbi:MAG: hypothetical protein IK052_02755 [Bacteroidales bacterium]|nr:hypothetical protein [Bacteroidales bacterium]